MTYNTGWRNLDVYKISKQVLIKNYHHFASLSSSSLLAVFLCLTVDDSSSSFPPAFPSISPSSSFDFLSPPSSVSLSSFATFPSWGRCSRGAEAVYSLGGFWGQQQSVRNTRICKILIKSMCKRGTSTWCWAKKAQQSEGSLGTLVIKPTFYLQNVEAAKVTLGILFWIINEHSVQVWEKNKGVFFIYLHLWKIHVLWTLEEMGPLRAL